MPRYPVARLLALSLLLVSMVAVAAPLAAQELNPILETAECDITPRPNEEIERLTASAAAATPAAIPEAVEAVPLPAGDPVEPVIIDQLVRVLREIDACAAEGNLAQLMALYTEEGVVNVILAPEPVPIIPGQPPVDVEIPLPGGIADLTPAITDAVLLEDGRVAALVSTVEPGGPTDVVWFALDEEAGLWRVDDVRPAATTTPTPAGIVPPEAQEVVDIVIDEAAFQLGILPEQVMIVDFEAVDWSNAALGCPVEGEVYAEVIVPGYRIIVTDGTTDLEFHTDLEGNFVQCEGGE